MLYLCNTTGEDMDWIEEPVTIEDFSKRYDRIREGLKRIQQKKQKDNRE